MKHGVQRRPAKITTKEEHPYTTFYLSHRFQ